MDLDQFSHRVLISQVEIERRPASSDERKKMRRPYKLLFTWLLDTTITHSWSLHPMSGGGTNHLKWSERIGDVHCTSVSLHVVLFLL